MAKEIKIDSLNNDLSEKENLTIDSEYKKKSEPSKTDEDKKNKKSLGVIKEPKVVSALMKKDYSFQRSMPSRQDIYVTINLKKNQVITDHETLQALLKTDAQVNYTYE